MGIEERKHEEKKARKRGAPDRRGSSFNDYRFVRLEMNKEARTRFYVWFDAGSLEVSDMLSGFVEAGYKVSLNQDRKGGGYIVSASCPAGSDPNAGLILTARADVLEKAVAVLVFKDCEMCLDGMWSEGEERQATQKPDVG